MNGFPEAPHDLFKDDKLFDWLVELNDRAKVPPLEERKQIERDLNLIEAKRALVALIDDAQADCWSTTDIHNLQAALSTVERKT